jgi:hypothetical protein
MRIFLEGLCPWWRIQGCEQSGRERLQKESKTMKKTFLLAVAAGIFTVASAQASDAFLTPKAKEQMDSVRKVPGTTPDMIDRSVKSVSPKELEFRASVRKVPTTGPVADLANAPRPTLSPKDPRFETAWRQNAQVQIAPLK